MENKDIGIWIRVSTEDQARGESPAHHEKRARMHAELQNYNVKEIYNLAGVSGKSVINHPEAQRMLYDIKRGHITGLIISKIARLARNTRELLEFADYFKEQNASLISLQESFDTSTPAGRLFFTFIAAIAEWEREEIVDRVNASIKVRAQLGKRLGGKVPYGYTWDGHELSINPEEATIRKLVFELFIQEKRKKTVARILNERGYRTRSGKMFYDANVIRWIRDPLSKGLRRSNFTKKVYVNGKMQVEEKPKEEWYFHEAPAIVSEEMWQKANDILDEQESKRIKPLNKKIHLFTRYIFCDCTDNSTMNVRSGNKYYRCTQKGCGNKIEREIVEEVFKEQLLEYIGSEDKVLQYLKFSESTSIDKKTLLEAQMKKREKLNTRIEKIIELHIQGQIEEGAFKKYHDEPYKELQQVEDEIIKLEGEIKSIDMQKDSIDVVMSKALNLYNKWDSFERDEKRRLIEMITKRITIGVGDIINIQLFRLFPEAPPSKLEADGQHNPLGKPKLFLLLLP